MIAGVVLAAGAATRFGSPKQLLFLDDVVRALRQAAVGDVVVAAGAYRIETPDARVVECPEWRGGPGASLRCGLAALGPDVEAAVVCLADGPDLSTAAVERVVAAWRGGAGDLVAASYSGERGHPVVVGRALWHAIPPGGARSLPAVLVPCDDLGPPGDIDTPTDLELRGGA